MSKRDFQKVLNKVSKNLYKFVKSIKLHKFRHLIIILVVVAIIFSIPFIFGTMSNGSYQKISQDKKEEAVEKFSVSKGEPLTIDTSIVKVLTDEGVKEVALEDYVRGVVSTELPLSFEKEAMTAQAILARTFVVSKMITPCSKAKKHGGVICDTVHCQVYSDAESRIQSAGADGEKYRGNIMSAVEQTKGQVLTYEGLLVRYPQYFAISSGKTENGRDVFNTDAPYLKSVQSTGEEELPKFKTQTKYTYTEFVNTINATHKSGLNIDNLKDNIKVVSRTEGGSVEQIRLGDVSIKGTEFRTLFGINSANFEITFGEEVVIDCKGYGHGVGMSQWGANAMAKEGGNYKKILKHYYTGVDITKLENVRIE